MARLLFAVWPYPTHLHPFLAVAVEARARGHQVAFYTGGQAVSAVAKEGFRAFPFREVDWGRVARTVDDLIAGRKRPSQMRRLWPRFLVETVPAQVRDLDAALAEWPADAIVCDIAMWGPILILHERDGIPVAAFSHVASCILPGPEGPLRGVRALAASVVTTRTRRKANAVRRQFGLAPLRMGVNQFTGTLPLYMVPSALEFDKRRRDLPPAVRYVGPCLWNEHRGEPDIPRDRPVVVVDEGALYTHEPRVLEMTARGLAGLPVTVVLLAGQGRDPASLHVGPVAENITLCDVLPRASVLVTNGNSESVLAALQAGIPVVVLPSIWDQAEMAWRVEESGVGLRVAPWRASPGRLRKAVERVLGESSFRQKAADMRRALAAYGGPADAARLLEELVAATSRRRSTALRQMKLVADR